MTNSLVFKSQKIIPVIINDLPFLGVSQIATALGYNDYTSVNRIYTRHSDEFTPDMVREVNLTSQGNLPIVNRVFSLRGCHLLAMFSKTPVAKEFRRWVLDLIEQQNRTASKMETTTPDMATLSSLVRSAIKQELATLASETSGNVDMQDMRNLVAALMNNIIDGRVKNQYRHLVDENNQLRDRLAAVKKAVA